MDCPDGTLCRITSSAKEVSNPVLIAEVPYEELPKFGYFPYKLITLGVNTKECEPSSEEEPSDEDEENKKFELYLESLEKDKKRNLDKIPETNRISNSDNIPETNRISNSDNIPETVSNVTKETSSDSSHKKHHFNKRRGFNYSRSNRRRRACSRSRGGSYNNSGNKSNYKNSSSNDIPPWLHPLPISSVQNSFQYPANVGVLRNSPFPPGCQQFHSPNQNNVYGSGHSSRNNEYHPNDYSRSVPPGYSRNYHRSAPPNRPVSGRQDQYGKNDNVWNRIGRGNNSASVYHKRGSYMN